MALKKEKNKNNAAPQKPVTARDARLFLEAVREDGVEEIYACPGERNPVIKNATPSGAISGDIAGFRDKVLNCTKCPQLAKTRQKVVFGAGSLSAELMFVGEAPGRDEDIQGLPFVGRAGKLLTKIIEAMGLSRDQVFIANVLKCRPPNNRPPQPDEILNCEPHLTKQIELIRPKIICALGTFAAQQMSKSLKPISQIRGQFIDYAPLPNIKVMCTFHPAYLLRNPNEKKKVWEDMKLIMKELGLKGAAK